MTTDDTTLVMDTDEPAVPEAVRYRPSEVKGDHFLVVPQAPKPPEE